MAPLSEVGAWMPTQVSGDPCILWSHAGQWLDLVALKVEISLGVEYTSMVLGDISTAFSLMFRGANLIKH